MGCRPLPGKSIATLGVGAPGLVGLTSPPGTPDDGDDDRVLAEFFILKWERPRNPPCRAGRPAPPKASNEFSALLRSMSDSGTAILMATHDLFRAKESGTRVGIMTHGRLVGTRGNDEIGHADLGRIYLDHMRD